MKSRSSNQSEQHERCLLCRQPAPPARGGQMLCTLDGDRLRLLGHLCAACGERLARAGGIPQVDEHAAAHADEEHTHG